MIMVWDSFSPKGLKTEVEFSTIISTNWTTSEKYSARWVNYVAKSFMLVLNNSNEYGEKPDGVLFEPDTSPLGFSVLVQKRRSLKSKVSQFDAKSNGTEFTYIDLSRSIGENPNDFSYSFWNGSPHEQFHGSTIPYSIKAVPKTKIDGDYPFRVFHIAFLKIEGSQEIPFIKGIEYYCTPDQVCKVQIHDDVEFNKSVAAWRVNKITILSFRGGQIEGKTTVNVTKRIFNQPLSKIDKSTLIKGSL
ncbi:MAG: hypothetical protein NT096_10695 [Proteobacteria bacterium]|nr:hypothetical protein [Pseudomonadota bacterium]